VDLGVPPEADRLYAVPAERFVAERDALARELAARRSPAAEAVRRLSRPTRLASALDRVAQDRPREVERLLDAADRLRAGQRRALSGGGAQALREAEAAFRDAARALRAEAAARLGAASPLLPRLELALRAAAAGPEADRERLRRGVFSRPPEPGAGFGSLAGLSVVHTPPPAASPRRRRGEGEDEKRRAEARGRHREAEREEAARRHEAERRSVAAQRALARAERDEAHRARDVAEAEERLAAARARLDEARRVLGEARARSLRGDRQPP
jgi:hypothetical protein